MHPVNEDVPRGHGPRTGLWPRQLLAAVSGALFTLAAAGLFAVLIGAVTSVTEVLGLRDREPGVGHLSSSVPDALSVGLLVLVVAFVYGAGLSVPVGAVLGVVNGALARRARSHRRLVVVAVAVVVGTSSGLVLPVGVTDFFSPSLLLGLPVGVLAGVAAGAHLWRQQTKVARSGSGAPRSEQPVRARWCRPGGTAP